MFRPRRSWKLRLAILALAVGACLTVPQVPGDEVMGNFELTVAPAGAPAEGPPCSYAELTAETFGFQATYSRNRGTGETWFTVANQTRDAGFDGQTVSVYVESPRFFEDCACEGASAVLKETLTTTLLSRSQNDALQGVCPSDGGVPLNPDAGITQPGTTPRGFDAIRACGTLVNQIEVTVPEAGACPRCVSCVVRYSVQGVRR